MDVSKDLLKLYHPSGQSPKEVATVASLVVRALYSLGLPCGDYTRVYKEYNYKIPRGILVIGEDGKTYRFKGSTHSIAPTSDTYEDGVGEYWVMTEGC